MSVIDRGGSAKSPPRRGDPIYVPRSEAAMAHSLGAVMVEGDARLFVPNILPDGVTLDAFRRWTGEAARIVWIGELLEGVIGGPVDLMDIAGLVASDKADEKQDALVPLYVPSFEMERARLIPGVHWDRSKRIYMADESADFRLVHRYLTPAMRAAWIADRNLDTAMASLVRARAMIAEANDDEELSLDLPDEGPCGNSSGE